MNRPFAAALLILAVASVSWSFLDAGRASAEPVDSSGIDSSTTAAGETAADGIDDLYNTLAKVLRARRPEEFDFLDHVVDLVDKGTLPRDLVISTFNWARTKPRRQFQYFEFGLRERAKRRGINL